MYFLCLLAGALSLRAQNETMVNVKGKVLSARDSSAVASSILYEKLPYYDDMGIAAANGTGDFSLLLVKGTAYNISIRKDSFKPFNKEINVEDADGDSNYEINFYLESDGSDLEEVFTLNNVIFARSSDVLQPESFSELDRLVERMNSSPNMVIQLEGHTDFAGNPEANYNLSVARVESVKNYLTKAGIKKDRILTKAFGGTKPLSEERTAEAMAKNRRVEVRIIKR